MSGGLGQIPSMFMHDNEEMETALDDDDLMQMMMSSQV